MIEINPLNVFNARKVNFNAAHFSAIKINDYDAVDTNLESWIEKKLKGRYYILKKPVVIDNTLVSCTYVGFEKHPELSYFLLSCPYLRRN